MFVGYGEDDDFRAPHGSPQVMQVLREREHRDRGPQTPFKRGHFGVRKDLKREPGFFHNLRERREVPTGASCGEDIIFRRRGGGRVIDAVDTVAARDRPAEPEPQFGP